MSAANQTERAWNGESGQRWITDADGRDRVMSAVADTLVEVAQAPARRARAGHRVRLRGHHARRRPCRWAPTARWAA